MNVRETRSRSQSETISLQSANHGHPPHSSPALADQQSSIFLHHKLKVASPEERARIIDAICARGEEMIMHRNWTVQRCLEGTTGPEERRQIVACMRYVVFLPPATVDFATNCYGYHVLHKALNCKEEVYILIVPELPRGDPATTLVNEHASHVWTPPILHSSSHLLMDAGSDPSSLRVNESLNDKWAALAYHETGSLVVQNAFENPEESAEDVIGVALFVEFAKNQWGSYCIQHARVGEARSEKHRQMALERPLTGLLDKSTLTTFQKGGKETLDRVVQLICEPAKGPARLAMTVDLALSLMGSQLIASVLPTADKDRRAALYDCIRGHVVTLGGCKTGSKVIWLFDRMRAYYRY
ncbi:armadillo-type protein [Mycena metata]|uniref:Armadillo-type protein n=1 Tax=Mycena metata TaxID=1033252 RepID=A0AAD7M6M2_9AGAR|nr:armadillo-type protein [Mycena metata]